MKKTSFIKISSQFGHEIMALNFAQDSIVFFPTKLALYSCEIISITIYFIWL